MLHNKPKAPNSFLSTLITVTSISPEVALMAIEISLADRANVDVVVGWQPNQWGFNPPPQQGNLGAPPSF